MALKLYNSLSKEIEIFEPLEKGVVLMYNCGPTVYDYAHVGNFKSFLLADSLRRYLEYLGYKVKQVMNITDVGHLVADVDSGDDKIEARAKKVKKTPEEVGAFYTKAFFEDLSKLNILAANAYPRASDFISEMQEIIMILLKKGHAYKVGKNIYYAVSSFPDYGKLSGNSLESLKSGARVEINPEKKDPADFALWVEDKKHVMGWQSPWGSHGYPGWHIECSAMSHSVLGCTTLDIHTGGEDNKFPHHECEIAQSEAFTKKPFSKYFIHSSFLLINGQKMSKSLGNCYTLAELEQKGFMPYAVRFALMSGHYRQNLNLTFDSLRAASEAMKKIQDHIFTLLASKHGTAEAKKEIIMFLREFEFSLDDDLNFPMCLGAVFKFFEEISKKRLTLEAKLKVIEVLKRTNHVLGLKLDWEIKTPMAILKLKAEREKLRSMGLFKKSDEIRDKMQRLGYEIRDTDDGTVVFKCIK